MTLREIGDVCRDWKGNYYVVDRIGPQGGTYGPRFYSKSGADSQSLYGSLNLTTDVVPPDKLPEEVVSALAYFRLTGRKVSNGDCNTK